MTDTWESTPFIEEVWESQATGITWATIFRDGGAGGGGAVDSVNGQTGVVVLGAADVGALPDDTVIPDISGLQATSEKNQPNGYAGLDGDGTVPDNRIPSSIARDTEIGTQITAHDGSGTAHSDIRALIPRGASSTLHHNDWFGLPNESALGSGGTVAWLANRLLAGGTFELLRSIRVTGLSVRWTVPGAASSLIRLGLFSMPHLLSGSSIPLIPAVDSGPIAANAPAGIWSVTGLNSVIGPGTYCGGLVHDSGTNMTFVDRRFTGQASISIDTAIQYILTNPGGHPFGPLTDVSAGWSTTTPGQGNCTFVQIQWEEL